MPTLHHVGVWDLLACQRLNRANHHRVGLLFQTISRLGNGIFWYALIVVLPLVHGTGALRVSLVMALTGLSGTVLYKLIKMSARRLRPCETYQALLITELPLDRFSFPSGHTLHAVAFTIVACWYFPAWSWMLWPFTGLIAMSRLVLGLHYPSDVLAGAAIGAAVALLGLTVAGATP